MTGLGWAALATPVGDVSVGCTGEGVARVRFGRHRQTAGGAGLGPAAALAERACQQLAEYFAGHRRAFTLPVDWAAALGEHAAGPSARQRVLAVLADTVGYGQTVTYGALASRAGMLDGGRWPPARAVGQIMAANPCPLIVPCHRVLAGTGLGGFSGGTGIEVKRWLLTFEHAIPPTLDWDPAGLCSMIAESK